jgi:hypothetical protein
VKNLLIFALLIYSITATAQTWQSIARIEFDNAFGSEQFVIDPYIDIIWIVRGDKVSMIEPDGNIRNHLWQESN